ncbi:selenocysteine synthase [Herbaspirillum sp. AP02]|uniref:selenocysteine synthase n=1 Tax=unclassified Herbaspirillum TaxID=2624150 RepID=UPI0015D9AC83|nr:MULTISPECIES: selenocysteine synthase [unclassified Herbaspirillum]MBG7621632.1 selenocysteine synthase [Herbaspirillum sp. AP02]NZD69719.1 selenocysteine synthase [Herbaspirillum sp. AP21]
MSPNISPSLIASVPLGRMDDRSPGHDVLGNPLDEETGYARGEILRCNADEAQRFQHAQRLSAERLHLFGEASIGVFTGNARDFFLRHGDMRNWCEEWLGPGRMDASFQNVARMHLGAPVHAGAALLNRTSAGIIAASGALASEGSIISLLPPCSRSHVSVRRGAALARARFHEFTVGQNWVQAAERIRPALVIVTPVTCELEILRDDTLLYMIQIAHSVGAVVLVDDAYGARLRPVMCNGVSAISLGADLVITSCDKAGMHGPRAGLMVGNPALVAMVQTQAQQWGMDARAPAMAGVLRALQAYTPLLLLSEAAYGRRLTEAVRHEFGDWIRPTPLGPLLNAEALLSHLLMLKDMAVESCPLVPCEASAAVAMVLLRDFGVLTARTHGDPGETAALHLKPSSKALARAGGVAAVVQALRDSFNTVAAMIDQPDQLRILLFGKASQ